MNLVEMKSLLGPVEVKEPELHLIVTCTTTRWVGNEF